MKISTKGINALEAMVEIAMIPEHTYISIRELATRRNCSEKYLEQIINPLKQQGFLYSLRGKDGGYRLAKDSKDITAKQIILAVENALDPVYCLSHTCERAPSCKTRPIWQRMQYEIYHVLKQLYLYDLTMQYQKEISNETFN